MTSWSGPPVVLTPEPRKWSGWGAPILLSFVVAFLSVAQPSLLLLVPLALLLLAVPPRRPGLVLLAGVLLALQLIGPGGDSLWWFSRGWALMLGAFFLVGCVVRPQAAFLDRALSAVFATTLGAAILLAIRSGWGALDGSVATRLRQSIAAIEDQFSIGTREWGPQTLEAMRRYADLQTMMFPALLGLASLAALAVVWWVWRRLTVRDQYPLAALREFSFRDELVWLVVAAVLLMVLPLGQYASRAGANLAAFMGALYALRGLAVVIALYGVPGPLVVIFGVVATLALFPMVMASALVMGLSDTWLDWRSRVRQLMPPRK